MDASDRNQIVDTVIIAQAQRLGFNWQIIQPVLEIREIISQIPDDDDAAWEVVEDVFNGDGAQERGPPPGWQLHMVGRRT